MTQHRSTRARGAGIIAAGAAMTVLTLLVSPASLPATASAADERSVETSVSAAGSGVTIEAPRRGIVIRSGCRNSAERITIRFPVSAGDDVYVNVSGTDGNGRSVSGVLSPFQATAPESGPSTFTDRLYVCGELAYAGRGRIRAVVHVDDDDLSATKPIDFRYASTVSVAKPRAKVARGSRVTLKGQWRRGAGFAASVGYDNRKKQRVVLQRRPAGAKAWQRVATLRINDQGRWSRRVRITKATSWRAVVPSDRRNLGATSPVRRIAVRR